MAMNISGRAAQIICVGRAGCAFHGGRRGTGVVRQGRARPGLGRLVVLGDEHQVARRDDRRQERPQDERQFPDVERVDQLINPPSRLRCQKFFGMMLCLSFSLAYHCTTNRLVNMMFPASPNTVQ